MIHFLRCSAFLLLTFCGTSLHTIAAPNSKVKSAPPKAILVMLSTEINRYNALKRSGDSSGIKILQKDTYNIYKVTTNDFKDNFNFCPVYFFYDTLLDDILEGKIAGNLLDYSLQPVANPTVQDTTDKYYITYFGRMLWQTTKGKMLPTKHADMGSGPNGRGLILNNKRMEQVYYVYSIRNNLFRKNSTYYYQSKKFQIEYDPLAKKLNERMVFKFYEKNK